MNHSWRAYVAYKVGNRRWKWYHTDWHTLEGGVMWLKDTLPGWVGRSNVQAVGTVTTLELLPR